VRAPSQLASGAKGSAADQSSAPALPAITLPKGDGVIRGLGEKVAANPVTGTGAMSEPIATSPGRSGFGPQLSLSYDSGAGNEGFGFGWSLSLLPTSTAIPRPTVEHPAEIFTTSELRTFESGKRGRPTARHEATAKLFQRGR
jgi:hypothetical protein